MSLITEILQASTDRLRTRKAQTPVSRLKELAEKAPRSSLPFRKAIQSHRFSVIAEIKRRSPSAGDMDSRNVEAALKVYDSSSSVSAISILTNEDHFSGSLEELDRARKNTTKPLLRKDFIVDDYQVWEARAHGADAILLMAGLHVDDPSRAKRLFDLATRLGMDVLFELGMSGESTIEKQRETVPREAMIWGVNSRRFNTTPLQARARLGRVFGAELSIAGAAHRELRKWIPQSKIAVAESGIHDPRDVHALADLSYNAILVGTAFLRKGAEVSDVAASFEQQIERIGSEEVALNLFPVPS